VTVPTFPLFLTFPPYRREERLLSPPLFSVSGQGTVLFLFLVYLPGELVMLFPLFPSGRYECLLLLPLFFLVKDGLFFPLPFLSCGCHQMFLFFLLRFRSGKKTLLSPGSIWDRASPGRRLKTLPPFSLFFEPPGGRRIVSPFPLLPPPFLLKATDSSALVFFLLFFLSSPYVHRPLSHFSFSFSPPLLPPLFLLHAVYTETG